MSSFNNTPYHNRRSNILKCVLREEDEEMENAMEDLTEEMEFDEAVYQYITIQQEEEEVEEEEEEENKTWGGSTKGKSPNKPRDFQGAYERIVRAYFSGRDSLYDESDFERRFRVSRSIFTRINDAVMGKDPFIRYMDATKKLGIYPLVKLVGCFRYLGYGEAYDRLDEHLQISESALSKICKKFNSLVIKEFGPQYLNRCPTKEEREVMSAIMKGKGFPGAMCSWDCKHFTWKNCPMRLAGQHQGHSEGGKKTLILESIADFRRYLWYVNFGDPGSLNDLNVLDKSSIVGAMLSGNLDLRSEQYKINGTVRDWNYFLVDGIYPKWAIFVNSYQITDDPKKTKFSAAQEAVRKDIECAFGILVQEFHILQKPLRGWYLDEIKELVQCCTILHNMIQEERMGGSLTNADYQPEQLHENEQQFALFGKPIITPEMAEMDGIDLFSARMAAFDEGMCSSIEHSKLKYDLTEHIHRYF